MKIKKAVVFTVVGLFIFAFCFFAYFATVKGGFVPSADEIILTAEIKNNDEAVLTLRNESGKRLCFTHSTPLIEYELVKDGTTINTGRFLDENRIVLARKGKKKRSVDLNALTSGEYELRAIVRMSFCAKGERLIYFNRDTAAVFDKQITIYSEPVAFTVN